LGAVIGQIAMRRAGQECGVGMLGGPGCLELSRWVVWKWDERNDSCERLGGRLDIGRTEGGGSVAPSTYIRSSSM
jgi:hypothetical protein